MDGTLIEGRLAFALADRFDLYSKVRAVQTSGVAGHEQTKAIAALFAGLTRRDVEDAIESIPLIRNCEQTMAALRGRGYIIGIISDSYTLAAGAVAKRLHLDFVAANELEMENDRITGRVGMPLGWDKIGCYCKISVCKRYHLENIAKQYDVPMESTLAVGDTRSDICMIQRAGAGVAFMPKDNEIAAATDKIITESDLLKVLEFAA